MSPMSTTKKRAVIYTRISRDDTGEGVANQRQEEACRMLATMREWEVVAVATPDISISAYKDQERPGWNEVVDLMRRGEVDVVIAWKLDRVTRTVAGLVDLIQLCRDHDVSIATTDGMLDLTSASGRAVSTILAAVAQMEVELKAERQQSANQQRAAEGKPWSSGFRAFGFEFDGTIREDEAELIRQAALDVLDGKSLRAIARDWNAAGAHTDRQLAVQEGRPTKTRKSDGELKERKQTETKWTHRSVKAALLNPRNAGIATYKGEPIGRGTWEPIYDDTTHTLLVVKLTDPARKAGESRAGRKPANLLTGIATCATCEQPVQAGSTRQGPIYQCKGYHVATLRADADAYVRASFSLSVLLREPGSVYPTAPEGAPQELWEKLEKVRERLDSLGTAFATGVIDDRQLAAGTASLREQQADLEARIAAAEAAESDPWADRERFAEAFRTDDLDGQRDALSRLARVTLIPKGRGNHRGRKLVREQVKVEILNPDGTYSPAQTPIGFDLDEAKEG